MKITNSLFFNILLRCVVIYSIICFYRGNLIKRFYLHIFGCRKYIFVLLDWAVRQIMSFLMLHLF